MKKITILFTLHFLFIWQGSLFGQKKSSFLCTSRVSFYLLDTGDTLYNSKDVYSYNTLGNVISNINFFWDSENKKWVSFQEEKHTYDKSGNEIMNSFVSRDTTESSYDLKVENKYDKNDSLIECISYERNVGNSEWYPKESQIYSYLQDAEKRCQIETKSVYDKDIEKWIQTLYEIVCFNNKSQKIITFHNTNDVRLIIYDEKQRISFEVETSLAYAGSNNSAIDNVNNIYTNIYRIPANFSVLALTSQNKTFSYDSIGRTIEIVIKDKFNHVTKDSIFYDSTGQKMYSYFIECDSCSYSRNKWKKPILQTVTFFDSTGKVIMNEKHDRSLRVWSKQVIKNEYQYNKMGNKSLEAIFYRDTSETKWNLQYKKTYTYDLNREQNIIQTQEFTYQRQSDTAHCNTIRLSYDENDNLKFSVEHVNEINDYRGNLILKQSADYLTQYFYIKQ